VVAQKSYPLGYLFSALSSIKFSSAVLDVSGDLDHF